MTLRFYCIKPFFAINRDEMVSLNDKNKRAQPFSGENSSPVTCDKKQKQKQNKGVPTANEMPMKQMRINRYFQIACTHTSASSAFVSPERQKGSTFPNCRKSVKLEINSTPKHVILYLLYTQWWSVRTLLWPNT